MAQVARQVSNSHFKQYYQLTHWTDPLELKRHHIVVTTYDVIKSEYAAFKPEAKNESKKSKLKASKQDSDSEAEHFGKTLSKDKPKRAGKVKKATMEVKWWRVVLGMFSVGVHHQSQTFIRRGSQHQESLHQGCGSVFWARGSFQVVSNWNSNVSYTHTDTCFPALTFVVGKMMSSNYTRS